jgi:hypothetical protein
VDGVGEEDRVRRDVGGEGERGERVEHVAGGEGVRLGPRDVRVESERSEVRGGGVVGSEGEEERRVVRDRVRRGVEREEEETREGGAEDGEHGEDEAEEAAARVGLCQRRRGGEERGRVEVGHDFGAGGWCGQCSAMAASGTRTGFKAAGAVNFHSSHDRLLDLECWLPSQRWRISASVIDFIAVASSSCCCFFF